MIDTVAEFGREVEEAEGFRRDGGEVEAGQGFGYFNCFGFCGFLGCFARAPFPSGASIFGDWEGFN